MAFVVAMSVSYLATRAWRGESDLLPWPLAVLLASLGVASCCILGWLTLGTVVADGFHMTCPRCGGGVTWLHSHWAPILGTRRTIACFRCNAILRLERTDSGWEQIGRDS